MNYYFRAFHLKSDTKEMIYQKKIEDQLYFENLITHVKYSFQTPFLDKKNWAIMLRTNYKDINNKYVYCGDIVVIKDPEEKVQTMYYIDFDQYNNLIAFAILNNSISVEYQFSLKYLLETDKAKKSLRILGNIYEKPELLKINKIPRNRKKKGTKK